jgi:hypothetical protein
MNARPVQIIEEPAFMRDAARVFTDAELDSLRVFLASWPGAGQLISGLNGARKLRWRSGERGKRGGARVIYFFMDARGVVHLLACYGKREKADLSYADKRAIGAVIAAVKDASR